MVSQLLENGVYLFVMQYICHMKCQTESVVSNLFHMLLAQFKIPAKCYLGLDLLPGLGNLEEVIDNKMVKSSQCAP